MAEVTQLQPIRVHIEYAFQVSAMVGVKQETYALPPDATVDDLVDAIMAKHGHVKNFDLRGKYLTLFTEDGHIYNLERAAEYGLEDGLQLNVEILNLDGG